MADDFNQQMAQTDDSGLGQQMPATDPVTDFTGVSDASQTPVAVQGQTSDVSAPLPPVTSKPGDASQKNPLDVLEKLLSEIDDGKPGKVALKDAGPTPEEIAAAEQEKRRIEYEEKQAAQKIIDEQKIEEQRKVLTQEMSTGAANVARAQQDEEKKALEEQKASAEDGYEILQIDHTKI